MCTYEPEGWRLAGRYPVGDPDGVGCWVLEHGGEAAVLEAPPGLRLDDVRRAVGDSKVKYILASHDHDDHLDVERWRRLRKEFPEAKQLLPGTNTVLFLGDEPLYLIHAPKHSLFDTVTVFRGAAMTGDIEFGTLDSVCDEVSRAARAASFARLRTWPKRNNYGIHTAFSAHCNDLRRNWEVLFSCE